jgi:hypothetical protein
MRAKTLAFLLSFFVLLFTVDAMADSVTGPYAGFNLYGISPSGQTADCGWTWILPNNTPFDQSSFNPTFKDFTVSDTCGQFTEHFDEITFTYGGFFINQGAIDLFGPALWELNPQGNFQFEKGQFALEDEFDYAHFTLDIHEASEPSSAAMLGVAFAFLIGWQMRKRHIV